jgi:hypothetical protein
MMIHLEVSHLQHQANLKLNGPQNQSSVESNSTMQSSPAGTTGELCRGDDSSKTASGGANHVQRSGCDICTRFHHEKQDDLVRPSCDRNDQLMDACITINKASASDSEQGPECKQVPIEMLVETTG